MIDLRLIQDRLSEAIENSGMSQKEIAKKLFVSRSLISQYYNKTKLPSIVTFIRLCIILDESPNYILGHE